MKTFIEYIRPKDTDDYVEHHKFMKALLLRAFILPGLCIDVESRPVPQQLPSVTPLLLEDKRHEKL